jgi:spermidine synthase
MTILQKYLSYVYRIVVEKTASEFNPELIVAIQEGKYVLNAKNANYSFATLHRVFQKALKKVDLNNANSILILGCGAGSIPMIIYKELNLNPRIEAVEIDEKVIELGDKYFGLNQYSKLNVVNDDAKNYVQTTNNKYDLILVDLFKGIDVPSEFLSQHFFEQLKSILNENGELLLNFVAYNHETKQKVNQIEKELNKTFSRDNKLYRFENINRIFYCKK